MEENKVLTVSQLNLLARTILEDSFTSILVEGEISNLSKPHSGHIYFSLKDERAQVRCAFFKGRNQKINFPLEDGMRVLIKADVSLYEARGDYQLIVQYVEPMGDGLLRRKFELLKQKLQGEGLFAEEHKKALPAIPRCIGVITSATGAAIRDILHVLGKRFPFIPIIIYPTLVQGAEAGKQIAAAIELANKRRECDVLILARGGGSLEDLWAFNEEVVAQAIFASQLPIVSGIGHEVDFTIADFVADVRAPTPSAAAAVVVPSAEEYLYRLDQIEKIFLRSITQMLQSYQQHLMHIRKRLRHPAHILYELTQRFDQIEEKLKYLIINFIKSQQQQLQSKIAALNHLNPLNILERGYSITKLKDSAKILKSSRQVKLGNQIITKLSQGEILSVVQEVTD